jgi:ABC-type sulfate transport system permease component
MLRALMAGFQVLGSRYNLCAQNLGAGFWRTLFRVELPLLLPAVVAGGSVVFLVAFSEYFLVFLVGGGAVPSFTGYLFPLLTSSDRSLASLLTLGFLLVPLLLFLFLEMTITRIYRKKGMN